MCVSIVRLFFHALSSPLRGPSPSKLNLQWHSPRFPFASPWISFGDPVHDAYGTTIYRFEILEFPISFFPPHWHLTRFLCFTVYTCSCPIRCYPQFHLYSVILIAFRYDDMPLSPYCCTTSRWLPTGESRIAQSASLVTLDFARFLIHSL